MRGTIPCTIQNPPVFATKFPFLTTPFDVYERGERKKCKTIHPCKIIFSLFGIQQNIEEKKLKSDSSSSKLFPFESERMSVS